MSDMRAAVFLADGFEEIEALTVADLLRRAEVVTELVRVPVADRDASACTHRVTGSHEISVRSDRMLADVDFDELDMIVLPGGLPGTTNLEACTLLMDEVRAFDGKGKWIAAICAAPGILGRMGLLNGRRAVSHPSVEGDLKGATIPGKDKVVTDGHIITSRGMGTAVAFGLACVAALKGQDTADRLAEAIVYRE